MSDKIDEEMIPIIEEIAKLVKEKTIFSVTYRKSETYGFEFYDPTYNGGVDEYDEDGDKIDFDLCGAVIIDERGRAMIYFNHNPHEGAWFRPELSIPLNEPNSFNRIVEAVKGLEGRDTRIGYEKYEDPS